MSNKKAETEYRVLPFESETALMPDLNDIEGVTEADVLAADRLLKAVADEQDSRVDYAGMLRNIKAEAMRQGLAAAANSGKAKKGRSGRILRIAASIAAAFVVGVGVLGAVKLLSDNTERGADIVANNDDAAAPTAKAEPTKGGSGADATFVPELTREPDMHSAGPIATSPTVKNPDSAQVIDPDPLPTETAIRGGVRGYTYIPGFTAPEKGEELYEGLLPETMLAEPAYEGLGFYAIDTEDTARCITCRVTGAEDTDLAVGVAMYTINVLGRVSYVWRIDESSLMYIEFEGFDYADAEAFLFSYSQRDALLAPAA